jgi:two-component system, OmpR family, phosphate regulon sensor histidine kinase PhoR
MPEQNQLELGLLKFLPQPVIVTGMHDHISGFSPILGFTPAARQFFPLLKKDQPLSFALRDPALLDSVELTSRDGLPRKLDILERFPVQRFFAIEIVKAPGIGVLIVFEDRSASRRLEQMRVDFVANASHELRTPLASLLGFVETLKGPARNDAGAREQFLGIMEVQAKRMARLIDDLLSLSRIELNAHLRPRDRVVLLGVIEEIRDALAPMAAERHIEIALTASDPDVAIEGDRDELLRLFENLIENAIKYGASGQKVDVTVHPVSGDKIQIDVRDYGQGIQPEHVPRLTERFYRVNAEASREAGGTGLGLAIVKHIVVRHRGRLEITSIPEEGSCFRVILDKAP